LSATCGRYVVFPEYSSNKTDTHDITEIFLKVKHHNRNPNQSFDTECTRWRLFKKRTLRTKL